MNFPDRSTDCGKLINSYLTNKDNFTDEGIHLLFTLNRWEARKQMEQLLQDGTTLIVDRYSYSGVAFSSAKGEHSWVNLILNILLTFNSVKDSTWSGARRRKRACSSRTW